MLKVVPSEVVDDEVVCHQAATVILANAEMVMDNLDKEVKMRKQVILWK